MAAARSGQNLLSLYDREIRNEREQRTKDRDMKKRRSAQEQETRKARQAVEVHKSK